MIIPAEVFRPARGNARLLLAGAGRPRRPTRAAQWSAGARLPRACICWSSGPAQDKVLVHAARTPEGLHFRELFAARLGPRCFPCCPGASVGGVPGGGLMAWLRANELPRSRRYPLCGSARTTVEVRDTLIARGVPFGNIVAEIYF